MLGSYVKLLEWARTFADMSALGPDAAWSIIDHLNPFNKRDSSVSHMRELYPNNLRVLVVARAEEYLIRRNDICNFMILLPKEYYLIPRNNAINLLRPFFICIKNGIVFSCKTSHLIFMFVVSITASA